MGGKFFAAWITLSLLRNIFEWFYHFSLALHLDV